ncbi:MAG TPA: alpha/beta hydrolase [Pyrinomonadaceae bacterium]|jgi:acetyl esterase/lipase
MRKSLLTLCRLLAAPCALLALLIILPAPSYHLWLAAVGVSEWSVWLLPAGLVSLVCGGGALSTGRRSASAWAGLALGLVTVVCASVPVVDGHRSAARRGVGLSWGRYFSGAGQAEALAAVGVERDVEFAAPGGRPLRLDVYQPPHPARPLSPAVIVIHGGSWSGGDKSDFESYDRWLAAGGRVVFDVEYRLANSAQRFPAQLADIKCAIAWVKDHAARYRVDPERLALLGRSAGGQLALLAAYTANDATLRPDSCDGRDTGVRAVVSFYGPTDLAWDYTHPARPDVIDTARVLENYLGGSPASAPQAYASASPVEHVGAQSPPTLFLHGGHDQLVRPENVERIIPKLAAAGVPFTYVYLPWANHGFDYNFDGWNSQIAQAEISKFLDAHL